MSELRAQGRETLTWSPPSFEGGTSYAVRAGVECFQGNPIMKAKAAMLLIGISASLVLGLGACASMHDRVQSKEDMLAAAGFDVHPATTPQREAALKSLPPNKFVTRAKGDHVEYLYADPLVCNCLYTGDQQAFNTYKRDVFQRHLADQQQLTAEMYQEPPRWWYGWSWSPWGWRGPAWW